MKKLLAVALAAMMLLAMSACALAEADLSDWVEVELPDIQMHFYRPADMEAGEITDADAENGLIYIVYNDDLVLQLYVTEDDGSTVEDIVAAYEAQGLTVVVDGLADAGLAYSHILVGNDTNAIVMFLGTDGYWYNFAATSANDNGGVTFGMILATLADME